ncbi:MAG TPA: hypothetical protein VLJ21_00800 [Candidatus Binatia bacterium]|nr:hypothetical protein [Candidatus Binatia bacterium]
MVDQSRGREADETLRDLEHWILEQGRQYGVPQDALAEVSKRFADYAALSEQKRKRWNDALRATQSVADYARIIPRIKETGGSLAQLAENLEKIPSLMNDRAVTFAQSLGEADLTPQVSAPLVAYVVERLKQQNTNGETHVGLERLPDYVVFSGKASLDIRAERNEDGSGDENLAALFFEYARRDARYLVMPIKETSQMMLAFGESMARLQRFFKHGKGVSVPFTTYTGLYASCQNTYRGNWKEMITEYTDVLGKEDFNISAKPAMDESTALTLKNTEIANPAQPGKRRLTKRAEDTRIAIARCRLIERYQRQEKLVLDYLLAVKPLLMRTLDL